MDDIRESRPTALTDWGDQSFRGGEGGEAHIFLHRLFEAFSQLVTGSRRSGQSPWSGVSHHGWLHTTGVSDQLVEHAL